MHILSATIINMRRKREMFAGFAQIKRAKSSNNLLIRTSGGLKFRKFLGGKLLDNFRGPSVNKQWHICGTESRNSRNKQQNRVRLWNSRPQTTRRSRRTAGQLMFIRPFQLFRTQMRTRNTHLTFELMATSARFLDSKTGCQLIGQWLVRWEERPKDKWQDQAVIREPLETAVRLWFRNLPKNTYQLSGDD